MQAAGAGGEALRATEAVMASEGRVPTRYRGPRGQDAPSTWRGNRWREGSQRYANRGGDPVRNAAYAAAAHAAKMKGKGKGKGKGSGGKNKSSGS